MRNPPHSHRCSWCIGTAAQTVQLHGFQTLLQQHIQWSWHSHTCHCNCLHHSMRGPSGIHTNTFKGGSRPEPAVAPITRCRRMPPITRKAWLDCRGGLLAWRQPHQHAGGWQMVPQVWGPAQASSRTEGGGCGGAPPHGWRHCPLQPAALPPSHVHHGSQSAGHALEVSCPLPFILLASLLLLYTYW